MSWICKTYRGTMNVTIICNPNKVVGGPSIIRKDKNEVVGNITVYKRRWIKDRSDTNRWKNYKTNILACLTPRYSKPRSNANAKLRCIPHTYGINQGFQIWYRSSLFVWCLFWYRFSRRGVDRLYTKHWNQNCFLPLTIPKLIPTQMQKYWIPYMHLKLT